MNETFRPTPPSYPPVFVWPPQPLAALRWFPRYLVPTNAAVLAMAAAVWWLATPSMDTMATLSPGWIAWVFVRNLVLVAIIYGTAHWWLAMRRSQGERSKFNPKWPRPAGRGRTFGNQTRENVFWTLASGVPVWTAWEVVTLWLLSSGRIGVLEPRDNPVWFATVFLVIVVFREVHFYAIHRLIHHPTLYPSVHALHHRNTNPGPWSGLSMHPIEHVLYFSAFALHWVVASHPIHVLFTGLHLAVTPLPGHAGFETMEFGRVRYPTGGYAHYLHHKLFEVNYADGMIPLDRWFGSFHDGSAEADDRLRARRRQPSEARP